ncbi:NADH dehydrogenase subunit M [Mucilaginibacter yixingensis]|uniref:NADH dehydrogenase subunit M n=1 Tax=Mucilaginibacter yixingensis TaxID=1295612 RepID=A0A2T5JBU9_9SPHI|nr:NADH-quinone oxidoreductase subunit M [Mucilaginibacter yixingensis]PTQ99244.1 NADH dehydrogenase subunit M [Mucilaginibacter yixingensis]
MTVSILIFLPLLAAAALFLVKNDWAKHIALVATLAELVITGVLISKFNPNTSFPQMDSTAPWIPQIGAYFVVALDGLNIIPVLLTALVLPLIILSTYKHQYDNRAKAFYALILFMQAGMTTVFLAMDGFLFYVGWEAALIPIYFICGMWGGENRVKITLKFFIYTFAGSLFMLAGLIYLYLHNPNGTFDSSDFYNLQLSLKEQSWLFWAFFLAFAIKVPIFPFHTWQPDTYTEAPAAGSMLLSGVMLKMGLYGMVRWMIPILPLGFNQWYPLAITLAVVGIVYASIIAFKQKDGKRLIAYSSIAHVGLISAAILALNWNGLQGAMIQMLSHGINVVGLFIVWDIISRKMNTRDITQLGGIAKVAPVFATCFLIITLGAVALPLTNGFVGEFLLLSGIYDYNIILVAIAGLTIILGAVYMLRMYKGVMQGPTNDLTIQFTDVTGTDKWVLIIISALVIVIGVYPQPILHLSDAGVRDFIHFMTEKMSATGSNTLPVTK